MEIKPIAIFHSPFSSKFGIPKQSGLVSELKGEIVFEPQYRDCDYIRGIDGFDYLWLVWGFSANSHNPTSPLVKGRSLCKPVSIPSKCHRVVIRSPE